MGKTVLITGASSGLGAGMAREFARKGYNLALCARRLDRLAELQKELELSHAVRVEILSCDVNNHQQVFDVFHEFKQKFGQLERIIINAGISDGRRIGNGKFEHNLATVQTNFVGALAQCEAAVQIFREQGHGHLIIVSSMSALRGMPKHLTVYAAAKAGLANLAEGIRAELSTTDIKVTTLYPGYIRTEINQGAKPLPFEVDVLTGSRALVKAIEKEKKNAYVPQWPWQPIALAMKVLPLSFIKKMT